MTDELTYQMDFGTKIDEIYQLHCGADSSMIALSEIRKRINGGRKYVCIWVFA